MYVKKLTPTATTPRYATANSAGADLYADTSENMVIEPGETVKVKTGIAIAIPESCVGLIFARSGLATKQGLAPANKVGVIDSDYRGEVIVALHNHSSVPQTIEPNMRIAQLVISPVLQVSFDVVDELDETERGNGGFGSTGLR